MQLPANFCRRVAPGIVAATFGIGVLIPSRAHSAQPVQVTPVAFIPTPLGPIWLPLSASQLLPKTGGATLPSRPAAARAKDPTQADGELRALLAADEQAQARPNEAAPAIPTIRVRARILGGTAGPSAALLIGADTIYVKPGQEYPLPGGSGPVPLSLAIRNITTDGVEVEFRPSGQKLVLP